MDERVDVRARVEGAHDRFGANLERAARADPSGVTVNASANGTRWSRDPCGMRASIGIPRS
jgi:hypothetical protein